MIFFLSIWDFLTNQQAGYLWIYLDLNKFCMFWNSFIWWFDCQFCDKISIETHKFEFVILQNVPEPAKIVLKYPESNRKRLKPTKNSCKKFCLPSKVLCLTMHVYQNFRLVYIMNIHHKYTWKDYKMMQNESKQSCLRLKVTAFPLITFLICYVHWKTKRPRVEFLGGHILDIVKIMID